MIDRLSFWGMIPKSGTSMLIDSSLTKLQRQRPCGVAREHLLVGVQKSSAIFLKKESLCFSALNHIVAIVGPEALRNVAVLFAPQYVYSLSVNAKHRSIFLSSKLVNPA